MSNLTAANALDLIEKNPGDYVTPEQLRALANRVHVEISNLNKVTVLYSGNVAGAISGGGIVSGLVEQKTAVRAISQTELYTFLNDRKFEEAVAKAFSTPSNPVDVFTLNDIAQKDHPANKFINAAKTGVWAEGSVRFASSAAGDVRILAPFSDPSRILAIDELPALLDKKNTKVTHINGIPKSIFQTILDSNPTTGLTRVNNAVAWSSQALMRNMRLETQPLFNANGDPIYDTNGVQKLKVTGVSAGEFFDGTGIEVNRTPTVGIKLENLIDDTLKKDLINAEGALARALEQGRDDIVAAANAVKGLPVDDVRFISKASWKELGVKGLGIAIGIGVLANDVKQAIDQGDNARAEKILANGTVELLVGIAVGDAVVAMGLGFISGLAIVNPITLAIAAGVAIGAGIYVGYQATVAVKNLLDRETGEVPTVRIEGDWKLTQYTSGLIIKELQTIEPGVVDFKWVAPDSRGTIVGESNLGTGDVSTYLWSGGEAGDGQMLERTYASDFVTKDGEVVREVVTTGSPDANKVSVKSTEHFSKENSSSIYKLVETSQVGGAKVIDFYNSSRESHMRFDKDGVKTNAEWTNKLDNSHGTFSFDNNTNKSMEIEYDKSDVMIRQFVKNNSDNSSEELVINPDSGSRSLTKINADQSKEIQSIDVFKTETVQKIDAKNNETYFESEKWDGSYVKREYDPDTGVKKELLIDREKNSVQIFDDGKGNFSEAHFDNDQKFVSSTWTKSDDSFGSEKIVNGVKISDFDDGHGYSQTEIITLDNMIDITWSNTNDGTQGNIQKNPDGSMVANKKFSDSTSQITRKDVAGNVSVEYFTSWGYNNAKSWTEADGTKGSEFYDGDKRSQQIIHPDGSVQTTYTDGLGNGTTAIVNKEKTISYYTSIKKDGSYLVESKNLVTKKTEIFSRAANGDYSKTLIDGDLYSIMSYDVKDRFTGSQVKNADKSLTFVTVGPDGSYSESTGKDLDRNGNLVGGMVRQNVQNADGTITVMSDDRNGRRQEITYGPDGVDIVATSFIEYKSDGSGIVTSTDKDGRVTRQDLDPGSLTIYKKEIDTQGTYTKENRPGDGSIHKESRAKDGSVTGMYNDGNGNQFEQTFSKDGEMLSQVITTRNADGSGERNTLKDGQATRETFSAGQLPKTNFNKVLPKGQAIPPNAPYIKDKPRSIRMFFPVPDPSPQPEPEPKPSPQPGSGSSGSWYPPPPPPPPPPAPRRDPLAFDLNRDGVVETVSKENGVNFDLDNNGFAERTSWVGSKDALLVLDRNLNNKIDGGGELFGTETLLKTGKFAVNGFEALAEFDLNKDGVINANDAVFSELRLWQDSNVNGIAEDGELKSLVALGIKQINLNYQSHLWTDTNDVQHRENAVYVMADGSNAITNTLWFDVDKRQTIPVEELIGDGIVVSDAIKTLPNVVGFGNTHSLHHAMALDNSGQLQAKVQAFAIETDSAKRHLLVTEILILWTKQTNVDPQSRGGVIDARKVGVLESFWGQATADRNPTGNYATNVLQAYRQLEQSTYSQLMANSHFSSLIKRAVFTKVDGKWTGNFRDAAVYFAHEFKDADQTTEDRLLDYMEVVAGLNPYNTSLSNGLRAEILSVAELFDTEIRDKLLSVLFIHDDVISGAIEDDILRGYRGNDSIDGGVGDDILYGDEGNDLIQGGDGADLLDGGIGNDQLLGDIGNDLINGRDGDDIIYGGSGADIAFGDAGMDTIYGQQGDDFLGGGDGNDSIFGGDGNDQLQGGAGNDEITGGDGDDVVDGGDGNDYVVGDSGNDSLFGKAGDDRLYGGSGDDSLDGDMGSDALEGGGGDDLLLGSTGNDSLSGGEGDDSLIGGGGNDHLAGGDGNNLYVWGLSEGSDRIETYNVTIGHVDKLQILGAVNSSNLSFKRNGSDLLIGIQGTTDSILIKNAFTNIDDVNPRSMISEIIFADGSSMSVSDIQIRTLIGGEQKDYLRGYIGDDILNGNAGDDTLEGAAGNDTLDGGAGKDVLRGESGADTYLFEGDWGQDNISDLTGKSVVQFGEGIIKDNLSFVLNGDDLTITDTRNGSSILFTAYSRAGDVGYLNSEFKFHNGDKLTLRDLLIAKLTSTNESDTINGTSLDDAITGKLGDDVLYGRVGEDFLQGDAGNDFLDGGEGGDTLIGGAGNDILVGGGGNDVYHFGRNQGSDFVLDRSTTTGIASDDKIVLDVDVLPAHVALYRTSSTNARYYNASNIDDLILVIDGSAQQLCIADFFSSTNDAAIESIVFGNGVVWSKQDILSKLVDQSGPISTLSASAGDDIFVIDHSLDVIDGESGGNDQIMSSVSYELPQNVRANITLTGTLNIDASSFKNGAITGNSGDNILRKNGLGDFYYDHATLTGGKGDDQYYARGFMDRNGAKLDEINADKIIDTVIENAGEGYDTIITTAYNATLPDHVEKLVVSGESMYAWYFPTSTYIINHFNGNALDNVIDASGIGRGNPIIDGGQGKDTMIGGTGDDTFIVDNVDDLVVETLLTNYVDNLSALTGDTVEASVGYTLAKNIEHLTLTGSVAINGVGNDANNRLDGSKNAAINHLTGGKGDDTYIVDVQDVVHENDGEGRDTVAFNKPGDYQLSAYQYIENIAFEDWAYELNAPNSITGNASDNVLTGNSAANVLVGGAGNDLIYDCSKEGSRRINSSQFALANDADQLIGGIGNDTLISYSGADTLDGGIGDDQLLGGKGDTSFVFGHGYGRDRIVSDSGDWGASHAGDRLIFKVDVHANEVVLVRSGTTLSVQLQGSTDVLDIDNFFVDQSTLALNNSIEKIVFSDGSFWDAAAILARLESNNLNALTAGNDLFAGSGSDDVIDALAGDDFIQGDSGNDSILGNVGNDKIFGGAGNDTLIGGIGNDVLVGGVGGDVYRFTRGFGNDFVEEQGTSSATEIDTIVFDNTILPADVRVEFGVGESESSIFLKIKGSEDQIILRSSEHTTPWSTYYLYQNGVENVQFADGTIWNSQDLIAKATANINHAPYVRNGIRDQAGKNGAPFQFTIPNNAFADEDVDEVLTYSATLVDGSPLPNWLSFNPTTGTFSGTIDAVDTLYINVTVRDSGNLSTSSSFGIYLDQDQTITGTTANDNLRGGIGNDTMFGLAGNDSFYGGYGNDTFIGGAGNEYYSVEDEGDVIIENANEGDDFVRSQVSYILSENVERLALDGGGDISATGNALNNGLWGNDANNLLAGAKGNDYLSGGMGNDIYVFNRGDGQDTIDNKDLLTANDTVRFGSSIADSDVLVSKSGNTLFLKIKGTTDQIGISNYYAANTVIDDAPADYKIEKVEFSNGVSWNQAMIQTMVDRALSNRAPTLSTPIANLTTRADQTINFTVPVNTITDADVGDSVTYSLKMKDGTTLPAWLSFNVSARLISGTPLAANIGILNLTLWGTDNFGFAVGQNLTMTVAAANRAPVLSVLLLDQVAAPQSVFSYTVPSNSFVDPDVGDTLSYNATLADGTTLPVWLSFNPSTRVFTGTPTATETLSVKVFAKDTSNLTVSDVFNIVVKVSDLNRTGTAVADTLTGGAGNDTISGLAGNDKLTGNAGNDLLDGGTGSDNLIGGLGDDIYIVDATTDVVTESLNEGTDTVKSSVTLSLATNVENLTLTGISAINGTGNGLNNVLTGNSAINTLDGGVGADTLVGAAGSDIYTVDNINDLIVENANEGTDQVNSSVSFTLSTNVENLTLTGTASINATGNAVANTLTGNAGNNVLDGGAGNDSMVGGAGNDTYIVDSSSDTVTEAVSAGTDLVQSSVSYTLGTNLENLTLTGTANINAIGNTAANILFGNSGNNVLDGGAGADAMSGGAGNDIYVLDNAGDVITENVSEGIDQVKSSLTYTLIANLEALLLTGTTAINGTGNALDNLLTGNSAKNILNGGAGNDILQGVGGDDTLTDTVGNNIFDGGAGIDVITAGIGNDFIVGGLGNDTITTNTGVDVLAFNRGDGMDILMASTGKDNTLSLGKGIKYADLLFKKSGNDLILVTGASEQVTMKDWYTNVNNRSIANLQMVIEGTTDYNPASTNKLNNKKIEQFNFDGLATKFDQARAANPSLTSWALSSSLLEFYLTSSDTAAIGGDLAYQYAKTGNLSAFSMTPAQALLSSAQYGTSAQSLQASANLQDASVRLV